MNFQEFIHMGGYAAYVWSAVGLTLAVLILNVVTARSAVKREMDRLVRRYGRNEEERTSK